MAAAEQGVARCKGIDAKEVKDIKEVLAKSAAMKSRPNGSVVSFGAYQKQNTLVLVDTFIKWLRRMSRP
ncbi:hypothetical protein O9929_17370 [Vibrio lentus]|nr:hypothetical protein [Vibrio lentus]